MCQRSVYSGIIGLSALVAAFGTVLPWATREQVYVSPDDVQSYTEMTSGSELQVGAFALLFSALLGALVVWFWVDTARRRVQIAALLMALVASVLGYLAWQTLFNLDQYLPSTLRPGPADQFPFERTTREGQYLTVAGAGIAAVAALVALLCYRPAKDRPAPQFQAIAVPWFLGLPAVVYLVLAGWTEAGLPFPRAVLQLHEGFAESDTLAVFADPFRHFLTPLVGLGLLAGVAMGLAMQKSRSAPVYASGLVPIAYVSLLIARTWYELPDFVQHLATPTEEAYADYQDFLLDVEILWIAALMVALAIWAGVGVAELLRGGSRLIRPGPVALSGLAVLLLLIAVGCARDVPPAGDVALPTGKITFISLPASDGYIDVPAEGNSMARPPTYVMNADGSGRMPLASPGLPEFVMSVLPRGGIVSPDGSHVLFFEATVPEQSLLDLYVANANGSGRRKLTNVPDWYSFPAWSPDGKRIVFAGPRGILVANADGSGLVDLGRLGAAGWPGWSPDGKHISFLGDEQALFLMQADGSGLVSVSDGAAISLAWSPDASQIAFAAQEVAGDDPGNEIFVANADGSARRNLSGSSARDWFPTWAPDGSRVAFVSLRDSNAEIYAVNVADGSDLTNLTNHEGQDFCPAWSPDGRWIAFVSRRDGNREIYVMKADGSAQTRLTESPGDDFAPLWQSHLAGRPTWQGTPYGVAPCSGGTAP